MITAKELAKQLNLSEAAVSMALNGKVGVSEKTRARVLAAAKEQGYDFSRIRERQFEREHPEGNILFLIFKKHGAVVADTPFFSELTQGIEAETRKQGYRLLVRYVYEEDSRTQFSLAAKEGFGGAVILGTEMDEGDLPLLSLLPFPVVLLDTYFECARSKRKLRKNNRIKAAVFNEIKSRGPNRPRLFIKHFIGVEWR